jgi:polar amino acid transport system substrate-binding protein
MVRSIVGLCSPVFSLARMLLLAAGVLLVAAGSDCTADERSKPEVGGGRDFDSIVANGVLRVAITHFDIPPFHIRRADGSYVGKDIDFIGQLGQALGIRTALVDDSPTFDAVVDAIASERADIGLNKLSETYRRLSKVRFSQPYATFRHAVLYDRAAISAARPGAAPDVALREFRGRIGVIGASAYVDFARASYPSAQIVEFPSWEDTLNALRQRKVAMVYRDEFEVRSVLIGDPAMHVEFGAAVISDRRSFLTVALCNTCAKLQEFVNYFVAQHPSAYKLDALLAIHLHP